MDQSQETLKVELSEGLLKRSKYPQKPGAHIEELVGHYWGNINFVSSLTKTFYWIHLDEIELFDQLGQHTSINSKITALKFKNVNHYIFLLAFGLLILFLITFYSFSIIP